MQMCDEITYKFSKLCTSDAWEQISGFTPYFVMDIIAYPCCVFHWYTRYSDAMANLCGRLNFLK